MHLNTFKRTENMCSHRELSSVLRGDLDGWDGEWGGGKEIQEREGIYVYI